MNNGLLAVGLFFGFIFLLLIVNKLFPKFNGVIDKAGFGWLFLIFIILNGFFNFIDFNDNETFLVFVLFIFMWIIWILQYLLESDSVNKKLLNRLEGRMRLVKNELGFTKDNGTCYFDDDGRIIEDLDDPYNDPKKINTDSFNKDQ